MLFATSKRSRKKWVDRLVSDGVDEISAHQMAWTAFPFDDSLRPRDRQYAKTIRSESWEYLRAVKGEGYNAGASLARSALVRWASMARQADERTYTLLYSSLSDGDLAVAELTDD